MKISHELPLSLLKYGYTWNAYDYCLPHLLDKYPEYREYFLKARADGRFIIMDNGLFEGVKHTNADLVEKIVLIKPDIFVVPDEWNNRMATLRNAKYWMNTIKPALPENVNVMVVLQGEFIGNMIGLYRDCVDLGYTYFAVNHSSHTYSNLFDHPNILINQMMGRVHVISQLLKENIIQPSHYIHLLGCSLPQELLYYGKEFPFIKSVDTSNPIIYGALGKSYNSWGILEKPAEKIEDFFDKNLEKHIGDITFNIHKFRHFAEQKITFS